MPAAQIHCFPSREKRRSGRGNFHRHLVYGVAYPDFLAVIDADEIMSLVLYGDGLTLGSRDVNKFHKRDKSLVGPGLLHGIPDRFYRQEFCIVIDIEHEKVRGNGPGSGGADPDRIFFIRIQVVNAKCFLHIKAGIIVEMHRYGRIDTGCCCNRRR